MGESTSTPHKSGAARASTAAKARSARARAPPEHLIGPLGRQGRLELGRAGRFAQVQHHHIRDRFELGKGRRQTTSGDPVSGGHLRVGYQQVVANISQFNPPRVVHGQGDDVTMRPAKAIRVSQTGDVEARVTQRLPQQPDTQRIGRGEILPGEIAHAEVNDGVFPGSVAGQGAVGDPGLAISGHFIHVEGIALRPQGKARGTIGGRGGTGPQGEVGAAIVVVTGGTHAHRADGARPCDGPEGRRIGLMGKQIRPANLIQYDEEEFVGGGLRSSGQPAGQHQAQQE